MQWDRRQLSGAVKSLVLQPHSDDAVMSAATLLVAGLIPLPAAVVSVFGRSSHLVRPLPARSIDEVSAVRRREDMLAWRAFPEVHPVAAMDFLDLPDRDSSQSETSLALQVEREIRRIARELGVSFLVVPYTVRPEAHPDHQILLRAAWRAASELGSVTLLLTQDTPYSVIDPQNEELLDLGYRLAVIPLSACALRRKHRLMEIHVSQMRPRYHDFVARHRSEALWVPQRALDRLPAQLLRTVARG